MITYSVQELLELRPEGSVKAIGFDAEEFRAIVEKVKQILKLKEEEWVAQGGIGSYPNRRRSSLLHHHGRPKMKHGRAKISTDADGWSTLEPAAKGDGDNAIDDGSDSEEDHKPKTPQPVMIAQETLKVKPNKNIASNKAADPKDIIADKPTLGFNAFAALESEEEDE